MNYWDRDTGPTVNMKLNDSNSGYYPSKINEEGFWTALKQVKRTVNVDKNKRNNTWHTSDSDPRAVWNPTSAPSGKEPKMFLPILNDIFSDEGMQSIKIQLGTFSAFSSDKWWDVYSYESDLEPYKYYNNKIHNFSPVTSDSKQKEAISRAIIRTHINGTSASYIIATPRLFRDADGANRWSYYSYYVVEIYPDGSILSEDADNSNGIAPCFCI